MADQRFSISKSVAPGRFEVIPEDCTIVVHYQILVEVYDGNFNTVAKRSRDKDIKIIFTGMERNSDLQEVVDSLIGQSALLTDDKRGELMEALIQLQQQCDLGYTTRKEKPDTSNKKQKKSTSIRTEAAPQLAIVLSKQELDTMLHESLQRIHWGSEAECIQILSELAEVAQYDRNLTFMIQCEPLMNSLCNSLKKYSSSSLPACQRVLQIFEKMSYFRNFHERLASFSIGLMSLQLVIAQVHLASVVSKQMSKQDYQTYTNTQNGVLRYAVSLLYNLSDAAKSMRKMVEKGLVNGLISLLRRTDQQLVINCLRFIRKIASISTNWGDIPYYEIIPVITESLLKNVPSSSDKAGCTIIQESCDLLFLFGQYPETISSFKEYKVFESLCNFTEIPSVVESLLNLFYQISQQNNSNELFKQGKILNMLIRSASTPSPSRTVSLIILMKLTQDPQVNEQISKSTIFSAQNVKSMFVQATTSASDEAPMILKLIRNVADGHPQLINGFDDAIIAACERNRRNMDSLCDIIAVLNRIQMDSTRSKTFTSNSSFLSLLSTLLKDPRSPSQLLLEIVMFISSVALFSSPAKEIQKNNMVDGVVNVFRLNPNDLDVQTQCMFAFYRFIIHGETRKSLLECDDVIDTVISHFSSKNQVVSEMAGHVLDALVTFSKEHVDIIRLPRFVAYNNEWLSKQGEI